MPLTSRSNSNLNDEENATLTAPSPSAEVQIVEPGGATTVIVTTATNSSHSTNKNNNNIPNGVTSRLSRMGKTVRDRLSRKLVFSICLITTVLLLLILSIVLNIFVGDRSARANKKYQLEMVDDINNMPGNTWKARFNIFAKQSGKIGKEAAEDDDEEEDDKPSWLSLDKEAEKYSAKHGQTLSGDIPNLPVQFDARDKWHRCYSVHQSMNQGGCGSCYATVAASVISDRICIHSNYSHQPTISILDIVSCCSNCTSAGCGGGIGLDGFLMWREQGIVTGGPHGSVEGCKPYPFDSKCGTPCPERFYSSSRTPKCVNKCSSMYGKTYEDDKFYAKGVYRFDRIFHELKADTTEDRALAIKKELYLNGPLSFCFNAFEDLQHYDSGIYKHVKGDLLMGHCVKMIGWGQQNNRDYWLLVNTWGRDWGQKGIFKMDYNVSLIDLNGGLPK